MQFVVGYDGSNFGIVNGTTFFDSVTNTGWHHVACVRDTNAQLLRLFVDGVQEGSVAFPNTRVINNPNTYFMLGALGDTVPAQFFQGYLDEFVLCIGKAMWTADFTPPTKPQSKIGMGAAEPADTPATIYAGINWQPRVGVYEDTVLISSGGGGAVMSAPNKDGNFTEELTQTVQTTLDPPPYFCVGGGEVVGQPRKLFLFMASNQVLVCPGNYSGNYPMQPIPDANKPADWTGTNNYPTFGCTHVQRMWAGGNASDPHRLYYSDISDHTKFTGTGAGSAGTIAVYPGQGEKLVAAYSIRGALIVWKYPFGVYVINTQDPDPTTWSVDILSLAVGGLNANCVTQIENDLLYMDRNGAIHSLQATSDFGDFNTSNASDMADLQPFMKEEVNREYIHRSHALYYTNKRQAWFYVPRKGALTPNLRITLGIEGLMQTQQTGIGPRFFLSRRDEAVCSWMRPSTDDNIPKPVIGETDGCIYVLDQDVRNKNGEAYKIEFTTANTDLSYVDQQLASRQKNGEFMEIVYEPEGEWDLLVDTFWDDRWYEQIAFNMGGVGVALDFFVLDQDVLGASGVKEVRRRLLGSGRRFRMTCTNDGLDENVSIAEFHLSFSVGDERTPEGRR